MADAIYHSILNKDYEAGTGSLITSFDTLKNVNRPESEEFFLKFELLISKGKWEGDTFVEEDFNRKDKEFDYTPTHEGELAYRANISRKKLVFDINHRGELVVIGLDAAKLFVTKDGQLMFSPEGVPDDALFHDGQLTSDNILYERTRLLSFPRP